eukprot:9177886-Karenia_brevis.AAC.1
MRYPLVAAVEADLKNIFPGISFHIGSAACGDFVYCSGYWTEEGFWNSAQPHDLHRDALGRRHRLPTTEAMPYEDELCRRHTARIMLT